MNITNLLPKPSLTRLLLIFFLMMLIAVAAIPSYLSGDWSWKQPTSVTNLKPNRQLLKTGLAISNWDTIEQREVRIGSHKWSAQIIEPESQKPLFLFLRPQRSDRDKPEVDWLDIKGAGRWNLDSMRQIKFSTEQGQKVTARFFRARNQRQTLAIVQWYATPKGGNPSPAKWFWADQLAQLQGKRLPWVAVSLQIPIKPLSRFEDNQDLAVSLAQQVQTSLMSKVFFE